MSDDGRHHEPTCPRCGYDLRGTVATWDDAASCPLDGTCTECGLTFRWVDVMRPDLAQPAWCIEYAPPRLFAFIRAILVTMAKSLRAGKFWRRLALHHEPQPRRLLVYTLAWVSVPFFGCALDLLIATTLMANSTPYMALSGDLTMYAFEVLSHTLVRAGVPTGALVMFQAVYVLTFALLPITRRRCKVRAIHLVRVGLYALAMSCAIATIPLSVPLVAWRMPFPFDVVAGLAGLLAAVAVPLMLMIFWYGAIRWHLRLPHPFAVMLIMGVVTTLLMALAGTALFLVLRA